MQPTSASSRIAASTKVVDGGWTTSPSSFVGVVRSISMPSGIRPFSHMLSSLEVNCLACRYSLVSGAFSISGGSNSTISESKKLRVMRRTALPGIVRPDRPERCLQEDCEHQVVTRHDISRRASYWIDLLIARSMMAQTEGKVRELSAMLEAKTTWHTPAGGALNTSSCSSRGMSECIGYILNATSPVELFPEGRTSSLSRQEVSSELRRSAREVSRGAMHS
mmetsp:Transcript_36402/g.104684  ORF Transcript_36402/g.104684 Transcript_36402/m.104684 type:complete len:222 (-) Transcript_36402:589-1254(-)